MCGPSWERYKTLGWWGQGRKCTCPPMRIAVCFDGRIIIHDHIPTNTLWALSPLPHYLTRYVLFFVPFYSPSINLFTSISSSLFNFSPHKRAPCFSHLLELHVYLGFPIPPVPFTTSPSTALRSEYPFKSDSLPVNEQIVRPLRRFWSFFLLFHARFA